MSGNSSLAITREGSALTIRLPAALDRRNASGVWEDIRREAETDVQSILFEAEALRYISPDGLDVILETKKMCRDITVRHARAGVCDTLRAYGFDRFLDIDKQYRFVSVKDCRVIGHGSHGTVYQLGEDTIIKVYRDHSPLDIIENERQYARNAFTRGIPTAIAYDVVSTEEGYGVIFEMINGMTLGKYLQKYPEKTEEYAVKFADLLQTLHQTEADPDLYADFQNVYLERAEGTGEFLTEEEVETLKRVILSIPRGTGMVHGDYHPNNVMVDDEGELLLIDMADISRGNGFFDLGGSYMVMSLLSGIPGLRQFMRKITSLSPAQNRKIWDILMKRYFKTGDKAYLKKLSRQYRAFSGVRIAASLGMKSSRPAFITRLMTVFVRHFVIPKAERYIKIFSSLSV